MDNDYHQQFVKRKETDLSRNHGEAEHVIASKFACSKRSDCFDI